MTNKATEMLDRFSTSVTINSRPTSVWTTLTDPGKMVKWMGDPELGLEVITDWAIGSPMIVRGFHHARFENKGVVLKYEKEKRLIYTHLSSLSRLSDKQENYSKLEFILTPNANHTLLSLNIENFATESIRKHLEFYWKTTLNVIKEQVESRSNGQ